MNLVTHLLASPHETNTTGYATVYGCNGGLHAHYTSLGFMSNIKFTLHSLYYHVMS